MFPQSYEFTQLSAFSEPGHGTNCSGMVMRNGQKWTVCYYGSEIKPKLMDCDLGEGTYQDGGAYPLLSGTTDKKIYEFMFTFDPPLILSSFTLHYYCSRNQLRIGFTHDLSTKQSSPGLTCENGHQMKHFTDSESETPMQNVTVTFIIPPVFRFQEGGIFLSEVQFFRGGSGSHIVTVCISCDNTVISKTWIACYFIHTRYINIVIRKVYCSQN